MSFMPAVNREIKRRAADDPVRLTLEFLVECDARVNQPVTKKRIVKDLLSRGVQMSETQFQQTILAESRASDYFIGSNHRGYFLIRSEADAVAVQTFYDNRIAAERQNRNNLRRQAARVGWNL